MAEGIAKPLKARFSLNSLSHYRQGYLLFSISGHVYGYGCGNDIICDPDSDGWWVLSDAQGDLEELSAVLGIARDMKFSAIHLTLMR